MKRAASLASAPGNLSGCLRNTKLFGLVGSVDVVTVGDRTAQQIVEKEISFQAPCRKEGSAGIDAIVSSSKAICVSGNTSGYVQYSVA